MVRAFSLKLSAPTVPVKLQMPTVATAWFQRWSSLTAGKLAQGQTPAVGR